MPQISFEEIGYAKMNLALHVRARRDDGRHDIETLFAFVDDGDRLSFFDEQPERLRIAGEFAGALPDGDGNLVTQAMQLYRKRPSLSVELDKRLPVAAGLGGGSADAGAAIRALRRFGYVDDAGTMADIAALGADVPACVDSRCVIGRGTGTELTPVESDLTGVAVLLVNPRIALPTGPVFAGWDGEDRGPLPAGSVREMALNGRNDLEAPAIALVPEIADVLATLQAQLPLLARMSGSGATCFALFDTSEERDAAAERIASDQPDWWQMSGALR